MRHPTFMLMVPLLAACTVHYAQPATTVAAQPVQQPQPPPPQPLPPPQPPPPPQTVTPGHPPIVFEVPREPVGPPQTMSFALATGRPQALRPGAPLGYWLWTDRHGGWHLLTTTRMQPHRFQGTIISEGARIVEVVPSKLEWGDRVRARTDAIDFDLTTQGEDDGFSFRTEGDRCLRFLLHVDGQPAAGLVTIGQGEVRTRAGHFRLCP